LMPESTAPKSNTSIASPSASVAVHGGPYTSPNACQPNAVSSNP